MSTYLPQKYQSALAKAMARRSAAPDPTEPYTAEECENVLEFEKLLRDAIGLSARAARRVAPVAWAALQKIAEEPDDEPEAELEQLMQSLAKLNSRKR